MGVGVTSDVQLNGIDYLLAPGTYRRQPATQQFPRPGTQALKMTGFDLTSPISQESWHGGRGEKIFTDPSRFYDSENVQTRIKNQVTLSPLPVRVGVTGGNADYDISTVGANVALCDQPLLFIANDTSVHLTNTYLDPSVYGAHKIALSFTTDTGGMKVGYVKVRIKRDTSNVNKSAKVTLYTDETGPHDAIANATCTKAWSTISTSYAWVTFTFTAQITLAASTTYWIVLEDASGTAINPRYYWEQAGWMLNTTVKLYDGSSWTTFGGMQLHYKFGYRPKALSQEFTSGTAEDITYVKLRLRITGTKPTTAKNLTVRIEEDTSDAPNGTLHEDATPHSFNTTISTANITSTYSWVKSTVVTGVLLGNATKYHIVLYRADDTSQDDDSWDVEWANDNVGTTFTGGKANDESWHFSSVLTSDTWAALTGDFGFKLNDGGASVGAITCFCHFFGNLYAAAANKLYKLDNNGTAFTLVQYGSSPYTFPAPITDLICYNAAGTDNQQVITGTATGGGWDITFNGKTVANINWDSSAWGLQGHFENDMDGKVHVGDVTCEGGPLGTSPITCTFQGQFLGGKVPIITVASNSESPLSGGTVTVSAPSSYMFIALGNNTSLRTMKSDGTTFATGGTTVLANRFATLRERLYALRKASIAYNTDGQIANTNWTTSAHVGNPSAMITGGCELDGVLYIAKEDGLYRLVSDQEATAIVPWPDQMNAINGESIKAWQGSLVFPLGHGLMKFTTGQVAPIGLDLDEGLPSGKLGKVKALVSTMQTLYAAVKGDARNVSSVWEYNGVGWGNLWTAASKTTTVTAMAYTTTFKEESRLWFSYGTDVYYLNIPDVTGNPANWLDDDGDGKASFIDSGYVETGWIDAGYQNVTKLLTQLEVEADVVSGSISVYYRCDDSSAYRLLGSQTASGIATFNFEDVLNDIGESKLIEADTTPTTTQFTVEADHGLVVGDVIVVDGHERTISAVATDLITISAGIPKPPEVGEYVYSGGMAGKKVQLKFVLSTSKVHKTPVLKRWTLSVVLLPKTKWAWTFTVRCEDNLLYHDSTAYPYKTGAEIVANLQKVMDVPMPVAFKDNDGTDYKVRVSNQPSKEKARYVGQPAKMELSTTVALMEL